MARVRWLFPILLLILIGASSPSPSPIRHYPQQVPESIRVKSVNDAREHQQTAKTSPSPSAKSLGVQASQISQTPTANEAKNNLSQWRYSDAVAPSTWSNWVVAIFAVVAALIGLRTLGQIDTQTKEAVVALKINRVQATAARRSADMAERSFKDLERPWIFIDIVGFIGFEVGIPQSQIQASGLLQGTLGWSFRNYGRSPALIVDGSVRIQMLSEPFPEPPDYGNNDIVIPIPLAPNKLRRNELPWVMDADGYRRVLRNDVKFTFYGFIRYSDTLQAEIVHVSRWCALLTIPRLRTPNQPAWYWAFEGPSAYTEYT
jgi:hypothetical protein